MNTGGLQELVHPSSGMLFTEDRIGPVFCKPKLIPLKSVTLEKLEQMQQDGLEKMRQFEAQKTAMDKRSAEVETDETEASAIPRGEGKMDIWQAS